MTELGDRIPTSSYETSYLTFLQETIQRVKRQADRPMYLFITLRLLLIVTSATIPALVMLDTKWPPIVASVLIALLTGLDTNFKWGEEWRHFRITQMTLERLKRDYEHRADAFAVGRPTTGAASAAENFDLLQAGVEGLLLSESDRFFQFRITEWRSADKT